MEFTAFSGKVKKHFDIMATQKLFEVDVGKNQLWELYLASFPDGTNPIYKIRTEHDCQCCKHFIRDLGAAVIIQNGKLVSIWDVKVGGHYQVVADALAAFVRKQSIANVLSCASQKIGNHKTLQKLEEPPVILTWNHFYCNVPRSHVGITPDELNNARTTSQVFKRGLDEITESAIDIVLELIEQNSLYRGEEFQKGVNSFSNLKRDYEKLKDAAGKDIFCWQNTGPGARIRNTVIGTLLQDISEGKDLDAAVRSYEAKVAPANYKRPTALITKGMIDKAMSTIKELGIENSLRRRHAAAEDLSINNVLFADKSTASVMKDEILDTLLQEVKTETKSYSHVEEVTIDQFVKLIPSITQMEVLFENKHTSNLMNLIAPSHDDSPCILKWDNNFSWSYNGNLTDSVKDRVKKAGGNIGGFLRISLS